MSTAETLTNMETGMRSRCNRMSYRVLKRTTGRVDATPLGSRDYTWEAE